MDISVPAKETSVPLWRPKGCDGIGLVLQGGGALGAYQAGVYEALHEAGLEPDWVAGVSIGAINSAIIAGNPPERRLERLKEFWDTITARDPFTVWPEGDAPRKLRNMFSATNSMLFGQPGFFQPNPMNSWFAPRGSKAATSFYDTAPLRASLEKLVDFNRINDPGKIRFAVGAVNVSTANFAYFDNATTEICPEHIMASGALPPGFPMVEIGMEYFWDGALISNTPLMHLLLNIQSCSALVFQVDLFSARGPIPRTLRDVGLRQKEIGYSSRTRLVTDLFIREFALKDRLRDVLDRLPDDLLTPEDRAERERLHVLPRLSVLELIYEHAVYEGESRDYEFSRRSMLEHWNRGYRLTQQTLAQKNWLRIPEKAGIVSHDINRDLG